MKPVRKRPWHKMTEEERRAWSAEIAYAERERQGLPPLASDNQHRKVGLILADRRKARDVA